MKGTTTATGPNADSLARARMEEARRARGAAARNGALLQEAITKRIHFDFDKPELRVEDTVTLDRKAAILLANPGARIRIAGNADERGSDEYNMVLGNRRAIAAKEYLVQLGVAPERIEVISLGEERPVEPSHSEEAWAKNRRDEFEVIAGDLTTPPRTGR